MAETQTGNDQGPRKKLPRGKPFTKGGPGGPGRGHKSPEKLLPMGAEAILDMKRAYEFSPADDDTEGVKAARRFLKEDYKGFMAIYSRLVVPQSAAAATEVVEEMGPNEERTVELAERLLREWEQEK